MSDTEPMSTDPRTGAPMSAEQAEAEQLRVELDDVEAALERLDAGTYGTCEACGAELPDDELERRPQARLCATHSG